MRPTNLLVFGFSRANARVLTKILGIRPYKVELHYSLSFITQRVPYVRTNIDGVKCSKLFTTDFRSSILFVEDQWQNNSSGFLFIPDNSHSWPFIPP